MAVLQQTSELLKEVPDPYHQIFDLNVTGDILAEGSHLPYKLRRPYATIIELGLKSSDDKNESNCNDDDDDSQSSKSSKAPKVVSMNNASESIKTQPASPKIEIIAPQNHDHCPNFDVNDVQHYTVIDSTILVCLIARCLGWNFNENTETKLLANIYPWNDAMEVKDFSSIDSCFKQSYMKHIANVIYRGLISEFELDDPNFKNETMLQKEIMNAIMCSFSEYSNPNTKLHESTLKYKQTINDKLISEQSKLNTLLSDPSTSKEDKEKIQKEADKITALLTNIKIDQYERFAICKSAGEWYVLYLINVYKYHTPEDLKIIREQNNKAKLEGKKIKKQSKGSKFKDVMMIPLNLLLISIALTTTDGNFKYTSKLDGKEQTVKFRDVLSSMGLGYTFDTNPDNSKYVQNIGNFAASNEFADFADKQCLTAIGIRKGYEYVLCRTSILTNKGKPTEKIVYPKKPRCESLLINYTRKELMQFGLKFAQDNPGLNIDTNASYQALLMRVKDALQQQNKTISEWIYNFVAKAITQATTKTTNEKFFKNSLTVYNDSGNYYILLGFQRYDVEITNDNKVKRIKHETLFKNENKDVDALPADTTINNPDTIFSNLTAASSQSLAIKILGDKINESLNSGVNLSDSAINKAMLITDCYLAMAKYLIESLGGDPKLRGTKLGGDINKYSGIAQLKISKSGKLGKHFTDFNNLMTRNKCVMNNQNDRDYFIKAFDTLMTQSERLFNATKDQPLSKVIQVIAAKNVKIKQ